MPMNRKYLPALLIAAAAAVAALFILRIGKPDAGDPHGHGHAEDGHEDVGHHESGHAVHEGGSHGGHDGKEHGSHGRRIELDAESIRNAGITVDTVKAGTIRKSLPLSGLVQPNQDRLAKMMPRFAGLVKEVRAHLGNRVAKGQVLAVIESNESLAPYPLVSQMSGTVIQKDIAPGQVVSEKDILFTVADLGAVWIDLTVHREDFGRLRLHQEVLVRMDSASPALKSRIAYLSPIGAENTQSMLARLEIPNPQGTWRPGLYVDGQATLTVEEVPMAVSEDALQTLDGKEVIFVREGDAFVARDAVIGKRDGERAELLSGARPGEAYCSGNSFVLKAELGKGEAEHEH